MFKKINHHEILSTRLSFMIYRLCLGDTLYISQLIDRFRVSERTVRRDINRLSFLAIEYQSKGAIRLSPHLHGVRRTDNDILKLGKLTSIHRLFPSFDRKLIATLLSAPKQHSPFIIYTPSLSTKIGAFEHFGLITQAVINERKLHLSSNNQAMRHVEPYRLINFDRHWYLVGLRENNLIVARYDTISDVVITNERFVVDDLIFEWVEDDIFIQSLPHFQSVLNVVNNVKMKRSK